MVLNTNYQEDFFSVLLVNLNQAIFSLCDLDMKRTGTI